MGASDEEEEGTMGQPVGEGYSGRKQRVTPRQLWERLERQKPSETPAPQDEEETSPTPVDSAGEEGRHMQVKLPSEGGEPEGEDELEPDIDLLEPEPTPEEAPEPTADAGTPARAEADAEPDQEPSATPSEQEPEQEPAAAKKDAKMVEPHMQPGAMKYPYATHAPAPQEEGGSADGPAGEQRVSTGLVLGVLIIIAALIVGISIIRLNSRVRELENRVTKLEPLPPLVPEEPPAP